MVAYRESITKSVEKLDKKYVRQSGGRGQYGHVVINVSPNLPGKGYHFENKIVGGVIQEYIPSVDQGIQEALKNGVIAVYPIEDIRVELVFDLIMMLIHLKWHLKLQVLWQYKEACKKAGPKLMEPVMKVKVIVPDEYLGDVMGDLNSRGVKLQVWTSVNKLK